MRARNRTNLPDRIGPFTILHRLGAGGMAETFAAVRRGPEGFEQRVCVKRVLPGYTTDPEFLRLFMREARLAAALSHRNVTHVLDFGEDRGAHYLALELVDGMDLRSLLRVAGPRLPLEVSLFVASEIAEGLHHAHTRGGATGPVVHRDVSPANTLVSIDGDVKLTDFGISKALNDAPLTRSHVRGNIWYMAPEQLEPSRRADPRSDLFSLGVVLYRCISGKRPYQGPTELATMKALSDGRIAPLREAAPDVPEPVRTIVDRLLAHAPSQRYQSAAHVVSALMPHFDPRPARHALSQLVQAHRTTTASRRNAEHVEAVTLDLPKPPPKAPIDPTVAARPRWGRYALAPGTWASARRAADQRRRENRPLPSPSEPRPPPPPSDVRPQGRTSLMWPAVLFAAGMSLAAALFALWVLVF